MFICICYNWRRWYLMRTGNVTISLAKEVHAVDTKNLEFLPLNKPIKVIGRLVYCIRDKIANLFHIKNIREFTTSYIFMILVFSCI